jgi:hypothetical protein
LPLTGGLGSPLACQLLLALGVESLKNATGIRAVNDAAGAQRRAPKPVESCKLFAVYLAGAQAHSGNAQQRGNVRCPDASCQAAPGGLRQRLEAPARPIIRSSRWPGRGAMAALSCPLSRSLFSKSESAWLV